jgi:hypothetical protein
MPAKRSSPVWNLDKDSFKELVKNSSSYKEVLEFFNLKNKGENFRTLKKRMNEDSLDYSHFIKHGQNVKVRAKSLNEILSIDSEYNNNFLKRRLIKEGILENICNICGQGPEWNNKPLSLQINHINGISNDNRLENLRILCPHCHSQTDNFAGKNKRKRKN